MDWISISISAILTIICIYQNYKYKQKKELTIQIDTKTVVYRNSNLPKELSFFYKDIQIDRFYQTLIYVWNSGNKEIKEEDISKSDLLRFHSDGSIFNAYINKKTNSTCAININANTVYITFEFLNKGEGFSLVINHDSKSAPKINGSICGTRIIQSSERGKFYSMNKESKIASSILVLFPLFPIIALIIGLLSKGTTIITSGTLILGSFFLLLLVNSINFIKKYFIKNPPKSIQHK